MSPSIRTTLFGRTFGDDPAPPMDVGNYASSSPTFPHESTADQWFGESQFESYRALGEAAILAMAGPHASFPGFDAFVAQVDDYLAGKRAAGEAKAM